MYNIHFALEKGRLELYQIYLLYNTNKPDRHFVTGGLIFVLKLCEVTNRIFLQNLAVLFLCVHNYAGFACEIYNYSK